MARSSYLPYYTSALASRYAIRMAMFGALGATVVGCVSSVAPQADLSSNSVSETNENAATAALASLGQPKLYEMEDGEIVAVPVPNPGLNTNPIAQLETGEAAKPVDTAFLADDTEIKSPAADAAEQIAETDNEPTNPEVKPANAESDAPAEVSGEIQNAEASAQPAAKPKPTLFSWLFKKRQATRDAAKRKAYDDRDNALLANTRTNQRTTRVGGTPSLERLNTLPGVKPRPNLLVRERAGANGDNQDPSYKVASAAGLARFAPHTLKTQTSRVNVGCILPEVVRIVKIVEQKYGKSAVVTSGYRSPSANRRAGGARNSMHIYCKAVDIQVEGVSKWTLAKFLRTVPGRGGVGTYCRTKSVHLDVGPKRDWHHSCRRKSKRRRKA